MKFYYYNREELKYEKINMVKIISILTIVITFIYFMGLNDGKKTMIDNLSPSEIEIIVLNNSDTARRFSQEKMIELIKDLNIKFPHIVMAQSIIETGHFKSKIFKENHNLFGMKQAKVRVNTAKGTQYSHAYYDTWQESVYDYAFYQCRYLGSIHTEEEYLNYLSRSYAEDPNYISKIQSLIKKEDLKKLFE